MNPARLLVVFFLGARVLFAQISNEPAFPDTLPKPGADSAAVAATAPAEAISSSGRTARWRAFHHLNRAAVARADSQARAENLFEDVWQFGARSLPLLPLRTGGIGQPRYFATGMLPPAGIPSVKYIFPPTESGLILAKNPTGGVLCHFAGDSCAPWRPELPSLKNTLPVI